MNHPRVLAALARPLDEVLVDAVRRYTKPLAKLRSWNRASDDDGGDDQPMLPLDEDTDPTPTGARHYVRPDEIAVAALLGQAFDGDRHALGELLDSATTTVIEVPAVEFIEPTAQVLRRHVVRTDHLILDGDGLSPSETALVAQGSLAIFTRDGNSKTKLAGDGNAEFASALQRGFAVLGISADPDRALPRDLVRMADHRIVVPPLDTDAIAIVIEAITGRRPVEIDPELGRRAKLTDLAVAVRADLGPARCVERLRRLHADHDDASTPLLSDLQGLGEARDWGLNLVRELHAFKAGNLPWAALDRGVLLSSPPGCGKTLFARSLAKTAQVAFVSSSYSEWQGQKEGHLGNLISAMRATFQLAKSANGPAIIFIDEIDSIASRGATTRHDEWWTAVVNALLEQIDGFRRERIIVIGACNHPSKLDPALVRSGRLDKHIRIPLPDTPALAGILRSHLGGELEGVDLVPAAAAGRGGNGADAERWVRTARRAARASQRPLTLEDLLAAIRDGAPDLPAELRRHIAVHESGHAALGILLRVSQPVSLSIHSAGGVTETVPTKFGVQTRQYLEKHIACLLAGRAAEELTFGSDNVVAGSGGDNRSDLSVATRLALELETSFGLGEFGSVWTGEAEPRDLLVLGDVRRAVRQTLDTAYATAKTVLASNRAALDRLAEALFARGYLDRAEIDAAMAPPSLPMACPSTPAPTLCPLPSAEDAPTGEPNAAVCE